MLNLVKPCVCYSFSLTIYNGFDIKFITHKLIHSISYYIPPIVNDLEAIDAHSWKHKEHNSFLYLINKRITLASRFAHWLSVMYVYLILIKYEWKSCATHVTLPIIYTPAKNNNLYNLLKLYGLSLASIALAFAMPRLQPSSGYAPKSKFFSCAAA